MTPLSECVRLACLWEAESRKVGNVHPGARFANTTVEDFRRSADAIAPVFADAATQPIGVTIRRAVEATQAAVGQNTNLGIILLLAPLAAVPRDVPLREGIKSLRTTVEDACEVYAAIRLANPGGLNDAAEQDVRDEPTVTLHEAMALAADRDSIARQYAQSFELLFALGLPPLENCLANFGCVEAGVIECQFAWLAMYPDSLIARKCGEAVAVQVRDRVRKLYLYLSGIRTPEGRAAGRKLDADLRSDGHLLNPGTTADLVTACLFVALREGMLKPTDPFRWHTDEWLPL
jgi:triphosphoribosyl-dephospho-CoA synthase